MVCKVSYEDLLSFHLDSVTQLINEIRVDDGNEVGEESIINVLNIIIAFLIIKCGSGYWPTIMP